MTVEDNDDRPTGLDRTDAADRGGRAARADRAAARSLSSRRFGQSAALWTSTLGPGTASASAPASSR
ncbi:hypothetical protein, partial [Actinomadura sp. NPDC000600]|uniref:hypothetical protein n=1 Tax=Actinomadura sp. NPDC000600 TaxID=3154262 RepID=UPI00339B4A6B